MKHWQVGLIVTLCLSSLLLLREDSERNVEDEWERWQGEYNMHFNQEENIYRQSIFMRNIEEVVRHNSDPKRSYDKGINQFSHLSHEEFSSQFLNRFYSEQKASEERKEDVQVDLSELREVDWQALGKVSPVKNQGQCDAGYAFCSVGLF